MPSDSWRNGGTAGIVVAAGSGLRARGPDQAVPKQYQRLGAEAIVALAVDALLSHRAVDGCVVVIDPEHRPLYDEAMDPVTRRHGAGLLTPVAGGTSRQASVLAGLAALEPRAPARVLIHDAARPNTPARVISAVLDGLGEASAAIPVLPVVDTLKRGDGTRVTGAAAREGLYRAQTPQGFAYDAIVAAHRAAAQANVAGLTDDAAVAEWAGLTVAMVQGAPENEKLTTSDDIAKAQMLARAGAALEWRTASGFDVHALVPGEQVILCGVPIPHDRALSGHSDADVAMHALTDALLGTVGDGDIGMHFPPSDAKWAGADSAVFLRDALDRVAARGGTVRHVDVTLICEAPKVGLHREAMRARLAALLGIDPARVSVKATTTERLGFTGRKEGIAAMATVTVSLPMEGPDD